jgi:uncharacterized membrane protein
MSEQWNMNNPDTPPPPGAPAYPPAPPSSAQPQNGLGVAALVFGILQFICLPVIAAVLAIVFGIMGRKKAKQGLATNGGLATAGLILGIVGLVLTVISLIVMVALGVGLFAKVNDSVDAERNKETGLVDGTYQMAPNTWISINDRCSFSGEVMNIETGAMEGSKTIAGSGTTECGTADTVTIVDFTVSGGIADITSVS